MRIHSPTVLSGSGVDRYLRALLVELVQPLIQVRPACAANPAAEADIVVTGIPHVPVATQHGSRLYMSSGSCSKGRYTYLALDMRRDVYGVHHAW